MKKTLITLAFLFLGNFTFAQSKDEEAIKKVITTVTISGWETINLNDFLNSFAKSEYTILNMNFKDKGYDAIKAGAESYIAKMPKPSGSKWEYADWKIKINGTSSFARCVETRTYPTGAKIKIHKVNYLEKVGKDWKIIANLAQTQQADLAEDEAAIKSKIISDAATFDAADYQAHKNNWSKNSANSFLYNAGLFVGDDLRKKMDEVWANKKPQKVNRERSNWNIRINGNSAFVTFNQVNNNLDTGQISDSWEERYMEKIDGEWKNVNITVWNNPRK